MDRLLCIHTAHGADRPPSCGQGFQSFRQKSSTLSWDMSTVTSTPSQACASRTNNSTRGRSLRLSNGGLTSKKTSGGLADEVVRPATEYWLPSGGWSWELGTSGPYFDKIRRNQQADPACRPCLCCMSDYGGKRRALVRQKLDNNGVFCECCMARMRPELGELRMQELALQCKRKYLEMLASG
jgi:hypothetical protein